MSDASPPPARSVQCAICGHQIPAGQPYCPTCGTKMVDENIVLAEVVGEKSPPIGQTPSPDVQWTTAAEPGATPSKPPRRPILEILLDPRTIQWLLGLGSSLLVVGLVVWLAALGVFQNALVMAVALGVANAAVLGGGWAIIRFSRYLTAGRALTLLACLVMPLNLWFYHAQKLVTLDGHLWVPALVCCVLYLATALMLRDPMFVYVLCGGVAMTGLLMLADMGHLFEIAAPATLLVVLGLIALHSERAFPPIEGPFSRKGFGLAFFRSGHALLAVGLILVLGTQIVDDWLYRPIFEQFYREWNILQPELVTQLWGRSLALALILAGSYAYFYSDIVVRRVGFYVYLGVFTTLWAEMFAVELIAQSVATESAIIVLSLTALVVNLAQPKLAGRWRAASSGGARPGGTAATALSLVRAGQPLGLFLCSVPVLLGLVLHFRATYKPLGAHWPLPSGELYHVGWLYVVAMLTTAASCRAGAHLYRRTIPWLSATYFFGTAAATLMAVVGALSIVHINRWDELAPIVMIVPILYIVASRLYRGHTQEAPLAWAAHAATGVMIAAVLAASVHLTPEHVFEPARGPRLNMLLAVFFAEATLFYALAAAFRKQGWNIYPATATACGAAWQLLQCWRVDAEYYTLAFAILGLAILVWHRIALTKTWGRVATAAFECANALLSLSFVAAALITLSRLATRRSEVSHTLVILLAALIVLSLLAAWLVRHAAYRRWYIVMTIVEAFLTLLTLHVLSNLTFWDRLEIFSVIAGAALLAVGHIGWHREVEGENDLVTFSLFFGSLLVGLPLTIAVLFHRSAPHFSTLNELGMLTAAVLLLASGFAFRLRATTVIGAGMLLVYLVSLLLYINMLQNVKTAAIWMTIGGGVILGTGILLSIYRDRLLTLPERIQKREGVFRVLDWR